MEVLRFGLGVRFDLLTTPVTPEAEAELWREIFSVLTASDVHSLHLYADVSQGTRQGRENVYVCIFTNGKLKQMRRIFEKLSRDAGIGVYLASQHPFIQNNTLLKYAAPRFLGAVERDGSLSGGEGLPGQLRIPKKHGKRRPEGKGVRILVAPEGYRDQMSSMDAVKYFTVAARRHYMGAKVLPVPVPEGGRGTAAAAVLAANGQYRELTLHDASRRKWSCPFGVLYGRTAVVDLCATLQQPDAPAASDSFPAGVMLRRLLDEGLGQIFLAAEDYLAQDCGMGFARALGVRFYDEAGEEVREYQPLRICRMDAEYLHPNLARTRIRVMHRGKKDLDALALELSGAFGSNPEQWREGARAMERLALAASAAELNPAFFGVGGGLGLMLGCLLNASFEPVAEAFFDAVDLSAMLRRVSLAVTAVNRVDEKSMAEGSLLPALLRRCDVREVPVAMVAGSVETDAALPEPLRHVAIMPAVGKPFGSEQTIAGASQLMEAAADRMFQFFRIGRGL